MTEKFKKLSPRKLCVKLSCVGLILFTFLFLISFTSALEFDNKLTYTEDNLKIELTNWFGLGIDYGTAKLMSHKTVDEIISVGLGKQVTMYYDFEFNELYENGLGDVKFVNMKNGKSVDKEYKFVYWVNETKTYDVYETVCPIAEKGENVTCEQVVVGKEDYVVGSWQDYNIKTIPKGNIRIGIEVDNKEGDYIDGIWTIGGKEVNLHASWNSSWESGLTQFYKLDEVTGTTAYDYYGNYNGTNENSALIEQSGIINYSYTFNGTNQRVEAGSGIAGDTTASIAGWFKSTSSQDEQKMVLANTNGASDSGWGVGLKAGKFNVIVPDITFSTMGPVANDGNWHSFVITRDGLDYKAYMDGNTTVRANLSGAGGTFGNYIDIGENNQGTNTGFVGSIDNVGFWSRVLTSQEIIDWHNEGTGITPTEGVTVTLNSPSNGNISTINSIVLNATGGSSNTITNMSLWTNETGTWAIKNTTTGLSGESETVTWSRTITDGNYIWNVYACDLTGVCSFGTSNYTLIIDSSAPTITIASPTTLENYGKVGNNQTLNVTFTDSNLNSCWYDYNGTNVTIEGCVSGVRNDTNFVLEANNLNITLYANDTAGNLNSTVYSWDYLFLEEGQSFNENAYETDAETFTINISTGLNILSSTGTFVYNGTSYRTSGSCVSGNCYFSKTLDLSLVTSGEYEEKDSYWNLILYDGTTSHNLTTETQTQNVSRIHLEECNATYTTTTLNFTAYREDNLTRINPFEIKGTFDTWLGSGDIKRNQSFDKSSTSNLSLCITPTNRTQFTNAQIEYSYNDENITYVPRDYYFLNESLTNITQNIFLYLLEAEDSTTFIIKVQDEKLSPVTGALVYIQRYYPSDGTYKTVQIVKTDSNGETVGFYETETVDYKHIIVKDGVTLLETSPQKVVGKEVPFTLTFTVGGDFDYPWAPWIEDTNISSTLTYNETTGIITFSYIDSQEEISGGRLLVVKESLTNSTQEVICNESSTEFSATITCNVSSYSGNLIAYGYIENSVRNLINISITSAKDMFGKEGLLIGIFIIMVAGMAFIWNPSAGIIGMNASVIFVNLIGFISVSPIFIFSMIFISIIAIILLKT